MYVNGGSSIKWVVWIVTAAIILVVGWWGFSLYERSFAQTTGWQTANDEMKTFLLKQSEEKLKKAEFSEQSKNAAALSQTNTDKNVLKDTTANSQTSSEPSLAEAAPAVNKPDKELPDNNTKPASTKGMINLNKATQTQLITIPGIGESKAKAIIAHRKQIGSFQSIEQLLDVKGIGVKVLEKMKPYLVLEP
ncbi:competence protein ComEA [Paenibacillus sp. 1_12]|uniref:ComEA family DNA-binding protein n=1 Tax=Paenibacillus sp. 1_12 TaxID=1566278 RepID=UPI0008E274BE|nr:helix-hairpin-helix domain-containing protein [Paenibacillus sp. 1_12]SFL33705.1 competence protein ComEA [Paenibacillus sp. 1_12]